MKQLDDEICAQFPSAPDIPSQTTSFQLRSLDTEIPVHWNSIQLINNNLFSSVIEARCGNATMECVVILKIDTPFFISGILVG
jgi:hypothetical protein